MSTFIIDAENNITAQRRATSQRQTITSARLSDVTGPWRH